MSTPSSSDDAASSGQPKGPFAQLLSTIVDPFEPILKHIGALSILFFLFGGSIFLIYFASIGFFPDLDLKTSTSLLAAAALTGAFLLFFLTLTLLAPGLQWRWISARQKSKRMRPSGRQDSESDAGSEVEGEQSLLWWCWWPAVGLISFFAISVIASASPSLSAWLGKDTMRWIYICSNVVLILLVFVPPLFFASRTREPEPTRSEKATVQPKEASGPHAPRLYDRHRWRDGLRKAWSWCWARSEWYWPLAQSEGTFFVALWFLRAAADPHANDVAKFLSNFISAAFMVLIGNWLLILLPARHVPYLAALVLFFSLVYTGQLSLVPERVVRMYKFGDIRNATLVLDETGCTILAQHELTANKTDAENPAGPPKTCHLPKVTIKSRLGTTYYVEVDRSEKGSSAPVKRLLFTIPATDVLSWACESDEKSKPCQ
jgi:hypothetical protein